MSPNAMTDRTCLVTGAATRVGRAIALALGAAGYRVAVHYHENVRGAEETCARLRALGSDGIALPADLSRPGAAQRLVADAVSSLGALDLLVGSAANFERVGFEELDAGVWSRALDLNLTANYELARAAAPHVRKRSGSMVFITCASTLNPMRNYLPYVVSKAALKQLVRVLALELAPEVRVNAVAPGTVLPPEDMAPEQVARLAQRAPLARAGSAEDVAGAVLYLATSPFVTGQELVVDGGRSIAGLERPSGA